MCRRSRGASGAAYARPQLVRLTSLSYPLPNRCRPIYRGGRSRLVAQCLVIGPEATYPTGADWGFVTRS